MELIFTMGQAMKLAEFLLGALLLASALDLRAIAKPAYVVNEVSEEHGPLQAFVCADGIRLDTTELSFIVLPPKFRVLLVNHQNRCYMDQTLDESSNKVKWLPPTTDKLKVTVKKGETTKIAGLNATQYYCLCPNKKGQLIRVGEFWSTKDIAMPAKIVYTCARLFATPPEYGVPMRLVSYRYFRGEPHRITYLDTSKVVKKDVPANLWNKPPADYKRVPDEVSLVLDNADDDKNADKSEFFKHR